MFFILHNLAILVLVAAIVFLWLRNRNAAAACSCGAHAPITIVPKTKAPKFARKWSDAELVKFSRRYTTLKDNEV